MTSPPPNLENLTPRQRALLIQRLRDKRQDQANREGSSANPAVATIAKRPNNGPTPVSFAQERLWFLERLQPHLPIYHLGLVFRLRGALDLDALENSVDTLVRRHDSLRTRFTTQNGEPIQVVEHHLNVILSQQRADQESAETAENMLLREVERPFDLARAPLWRTGLIELADTDRLFFFVVHHIITDGWSQEILARELGQLYIASSRGQDPPNLPRLTVQYADFATWQRQWLDGDEFERQLDYWRRRLKHLPTLRLPWDHTRPTAPTHRGHRDEFHLPSSVGAKLMKISAALGVTPFMILTALVGSLLSRHGGRRDLALGTPVAGRQKPELEPMVGFFVNMLVLRLDLSDVACFNDAIAHVREIALEAFAHQDLPFEKLVEELDPERELGRNPLFQTTFSLQNIERAQVHWAGLEAHRTAFHPSSARTRFDLEISARQDEKTGWRMRFVASADLFDITTLKRLARHGQRFLENAIARPKEQLDALPLLSAAELRQLSELSGSTPSVPERTISQLFEARVIERPWAIALDSSPSALTYNELNRRANRLAHELIHRGVGPETSVALCLERGLAMVTAILAILKAGGVYVPLDPEPPENRRAFMLHDSAAKVLIVPPGSLAEWSDFKGQVVQLNAHETRLESDENPPSRASTNHLAYILYTSGSTGRPKGVGVPHRGVVRLLHDANYVDLGPREVFLQLAPTSFDASTFELWASLLHGARLVVFPPLNPSLEELAVTLETHRVSTLWLTSALFQQMVTVEGPRLAHVRQVLAGGETLPVTSVRRALRKLPAGHRLINGYGPTENTTFTCCHTMDSGSQPTGSVPIGRPITHTRVYLVDRSLQTVPLGIPGQLVTGGAGLARGYLNHPRLTAEKFVPDALGGLGGARLYKTGDLARYPARGTLEFLGRTDHQIKLRGFRIELTEIDAVLEELPKVARAVTLLQNSDTENPSLTTFWLRHGEEAAVDSTSQLQDHLAARFPSYMMPKFFVMVEKIPLTPHGKVDRRSLSSRASDESSPANTEKRPIETLPMAAPQDALERQLVSLWEQVLKRNPIGIHDSFFELGGHSLLAIRLFALIEESLGRALPISTLFQAPTVAELAAFLRDRGWAMRWSSIVPIHPWGDRTPLFCVHGVTGDPFIYRTLVGHLSPDQPLYGLQARGMAGEAEPFTRIEDMASHYLSEIRSIQPRGPYLLGGFCFGGYTAFEIARQISAQGEKVALLALFDTPAPITNALPAKIFLGYRLRQLLRFARYHVEQFRATPWSQKLAYLRDRRAGLRRLRLSTLRLLRTLGWGLAPSAIQVDVAEANRRALQIFRPGAYTQPVTVFRSREFPQHGIHDPQLGWELLAAAVTLHEVPGRHHGMFDEPRVEQLAELLGKALEPH